MLTSAINALKVEPTPMLEDIDGEADVQILSRLKIFHHKGVSSYKGVDDGFADM